MNMMQKMADKMPIHNAFFFTVRGKFFRIFPGRPRSTRSYSLVVQAVTLIVPTSEESNQKMTNMYIIGEMCSLVNRENQPWANKTPLLGGS